MATNMEMIKKIAGDPLDDASEAAYRLAATGLVKLVSTTMVDTLVKDENIKTFLKKYDEIQELVTGFLLAAIMEVIPIEGLNDERKRLAYNLRVRSYEEIGELGVSIIDLAALPRLQSFIMIEIQKAVLLAKGYEIKEVISEDKSSMQADQKPENQNVQDTTKEVEDIIPSVVSAPMPDIQNVPSAEGTARVKGKSR